MCKTGSNESVKDLINWIMLLSSLKSPTAPKSGETEFSHEWRICNNRVNGARERESLPSWTQISSSVCAKMLWWTEINRCSLLFHPFISQSGVSFWKMTVIHWLHFHRHAVWEWGLFFLAHIQNTKCVVINYVCKILCQENKAKWDHRECVYDLLIR